MGQQARLGDAILDRVRGAATPAYDRSAVSEGIVHLGVGAFHRAHQAVYVDDCLGAGEHGWGITGVSLRSPDTRDALGPQGGLYTIAVRDGSGDALRVIGSMKSLLVAPEDPEVVLARMADPRVRIVTLTVTEKAYLRDANGELDAGHPDIVWDIANSEKPRTVFGFLAGALARRRAAGFPPFTVLCCDNLPANGETVRRLTLQFVGLAGDDLAAFIAKEVAFPSTMVDRIVPATTDADRARVSEALGAEDAWPVMTEPFMQWVVEENFPAGRPRWEKFGVTMVEDVAPFEDMKLRLLNGAHSGIAYLGLLTGHPTVADSFGDPLIRGFVERYWREVIPTLPKDAGLDTDAYTAALTERFSNPALRHRTAQIAMDGSQKLPQRIIASARLRLKEDRPIANLMLVAAAWIAACRERGRSLPAGHFTDPLDAKLADIFAVTDEPAELVRAVFAAAGFSAEGKEAMEAAASKHLTIIFEKGAAGAISAAAEERA
ncbi:mannitol dehydrogenase family protein [Mesorhizobium sp. LHD-90]|uniref:mannitol dehydrogenase family protein n=1 Tax=Mesorhizobium sp. LHD-90 TaxID=3071414 RepID=UPI0027E177FB|nr:mannitol dehydrogenase family protein [Mesorhizobium sp. LHD-90]MDQ6433347.1 mannitol dehydrogenase family protein [Mesorhizobium sp. LHD-90]